MSHRAFLLLVAAFLLALTLLHHTRERGPAQVTANNDAYAQRLPAIKAEIRGRIDAGEDPAEVAADIVNRLRKEDRDAGLGR
jgi:hypothetical protein